jgi:ER lumen protein retaining receptor
MPYKLGYDKELDSLNHYAFIYPPVLLMTILIHTTNRYTGFWNITWTFSVWLEAVAIVPQLYIVYKKREVRSNPRSK